MSNKHIVEFMRKRSPCIGNRKYVVAGATLFGYFTLMIDRSLRNAMEQARSLSEQLEAVAISTYPPSMLVTSLLLMVSNIQDPWKYLATVSITDGITGIRKIQYLQDERSCPECRRGPGI